MPDESSKQEEMQSMSLVSSQMKTQPIESQLTS